MEPQVLAVERLEREQLTRRVRLVLWIQSHQFIDSRKLLDVNHARISWSLSAVLAKPLRRAMCLAFYARGKDERLSVMRAYLVRLEFEDLPRRQHRAIRHHLSRKST